MARNCALCGQPLPRKVRDLKIVYPRIAKRVVMSVYADKRKRTWLAEQHRIPYRLVTRIKRCASVEEAIANHATETK